MEVVCTPVSRLSAPKGVRYVCELTGDPATLQCTLHGVHYYYSSQHHQQVDFEGVLEKIGPILAPLKEAEEAKTGTSEEREQREQHLQNTRKALIEICRSEASKFLVANKFELAIPGALRFLRFTQQVYGQTCQQVVPAYLLLAEAQLGLGLTRQAEEFLCRARWAIQQDPNPSQIILAQMHRNFGKLFKTKNQPKMALHHFAQDVYFSALDMGPEHPDTARGYFHLATVFYSMKQVEHALAFFDKVVDCWYKYLLGTGDDGMGMSEAQLQEARGMLEYIADRRQKFLTATHIATGEVRYTLALLLIGMDVDHELAYEHVKEALQVYIARLGPDHPSTKDVQTTLASIENLRPVA